MYFNNLKNVLITPLKTVLVVRRFGHPFLLWNTLLYIFITESFNQNLCYLTDVELRRLHRRFRHLLVQRLERILNRIGYKNDANCKTLKHITRYCLYYQKYRKSLGRFRFTLKDNVNFNYCIIINIIYINSKPVFYIVNKGTRF